MATRVLVVDDSDAIRSMLRMRLEHEGCVVVGEAADGVTAVEEAERLAPDLVIMDLEMPGLSGDEATVQLLKRAPTMRIVGYTSSSNDARKRMLQAGAEAAFDKQDFKGLLAYVATVF